LIGNAIKFENKIKAVFIKNQKNSKLEIQLENVRRNLEIQSLKLELERDLINFRSNE
jgi:hypothetical protein